MSILKDDYIQPELDPDNPDISAYILQKEVEHVEAHVDTDLRVGPIYSIDRTHNEYTFPKAAITSENGTRLMTWTEYAYYMLDRNLREGIYPALSVMDIGCGTGNALITFYDEIVRNRFNGSYEKANKHLHFAGISLVDYRRYRPKIDADSSSSMLDRFKINYIIGNVQEYQLLRQTLCEPNYDLVTSYYCLPYLKSDRVIVDVWHQIYNSLKIGGAAYIYENGVYTDRRSNLPLADNFDVMRLIYRRFEVQKINHELANRGLNIKLHGDYTYGNHLTMVKNIEPFSMPFRYAPNGKRLEDYRERYGLDNNDEPYSSDNDIMRAFAVLLREYDSFLYMNHYLVKFLADSAKTMPKLSENHLQYLADNFYYYMIQYSITEMERNGITKESLDAKICELFQ